MPRLPSYRNQLTGSYMTVTLVFDELNLNLCLPAQMKIINYDVSLTDVSIQQWTSSKIGGHLVHS